MMENYITGILLASSSCNYNTIRNNTVLQTRNGIAVNFGQNNTIIDNYIGDSLPGSLFTRSYGIYLLFSPGNTVEGNTLDSNINYGLYMSNSSGNSLTDNIASGNTEYGFYLTSSNINIINGICNVLPRD